MYESLRESIKNSDEIIMNVSFIRDSGMKLLIKDLKEAKEQGKKIKILTPSRAATARILLRTQIRLPAQA